MAEDYKQEIGSMLIKKNPGKSINRLGKYYLMGELNRLGYISELKGGIVS